MNYEIDDIRITREDVDGNVLPNPVVMRVCINEDTVKESKTYDEVKCLLKTSARKVEGASTVGGSLKFKMDAFTQQMILTHTLGEKTSLADASSDDWAASTVITKDAIVNTSDGKWSLVAVKVSGSGSTGVTEPTVVAKGDRITDANVVWIAMPKLLKAVHPLTCSAPMFRYEIKLTEINGAGVFYKQYQHLELGSLPIALDGGSGTYDLSIDPKGGVGVDSEDEAWTENLLAITGAVEVESDSDFYGGDCQLTSLKINDAVDDTDSFTLTMDKGMTSEDALNCRKKISRDLKIDGSLTKDFTPAAYYVFKQRDTFDAKVGLATAVGARCDYHIPNVRPEFADPDRESKTSVMISPNISAEEIGDVPAITATVIFPALMNASNVIVGDGSW